MGRTNKTKKRNVEVVLNVLAFDPSMTAFGWAVLNANNEVLDRGCIKTESEHKKLRIRKGDDTVRRINEVAEVLKQVMHEYDINFVVSELPHGSQSSTAAEMLGIVKGIVATACVFRGISVEWYSEADAKKAVFGNKKTVSKTEMVNQISKLYAVDWFGVKYKDEAVADALALHVTAMKNSATLKLFGNGR